jgi:putative transcriptional regulator
VLLASPVLEDPNFRRTVIVVCEHGEEGSFGLVLNRPLTLKPGDVFDSLEPVPHAISYGGPVQPDTMHFLHRLGDRLEDAVPVVEDVSWGGDFTLLEALLAANPGLGVRARFFMGYAGWESGQLEEEIAEGSWIVSAIAPPVFAAEPGHLWRDSLLALGGDLALLANFPADPRLN